MIVSIPYKKTDKTDVAKQLDRYIRMTYDGDTGDKYLPELNEFNAARENMRTAVDRFPNEPEKVKEAIVAYLPWVTSFVLRFPHTGNDANLKISFTWGDAFRGKKQSVMNGYYEYANVLFNLGAAESQIGAVTLKADATESGFSGAYAHFQNAAYFLGAASRAAQEHDASGGLGDLEEGAAEGLAQVMLGCAQYCVFSKGLRKGMSPAVLSKVEGQVSLFMEAGVRGVQESAGVGSAARDWTRHAHAAALAHKADTCLRLNDVLAAAGKHELRLGRLQQAVASLDEAKRGVAKMASGPAQQELRAAVDRLAATAAAAAQKGAQENSLIYHLTVPSVASLPPLDGAPMAKAAATQDLLPLAEGGGGAASAAHFAELTPAHVTAAVRAYAAQRDQRVGAVLAAMEDADKALAAALGEMGLPGKLEALASAAAASSAAGGQGQGQGQIPESLAEKAAHVRQEGGARHVEERIELVAKMAEEAAAAISEAEGLIEAEEREDNELRAKYAQRWSRCPSYSINTGFREEIAKLRTHAASAKKSDAFVVERWRAAAPAVATLELSPAEIAAQLPPAMDASAVAALAAAPETAALRADLNALRQIAMDRAAARAALQQAAAADDITPAILAADGEDAYAGVIQDALQKYDAHEAAAQDGAAAQDDALRRTAQDNAAFDDARRAATGSGDPRTEAVQGLEAAAKTFGELRANLAEGINFYSELQTRIQNLKAKISDFTYARQTEKQDLLAVLTGGGRSAGGAQPPARPPKPAGYPQAPYPQQPPQYGQQPQQPPQYGQQQVPGGWSPYQHSQYTTSAPPPQPYGAYPPQQQQQYQYGGYPPPQQQPYGGYPPQQRRW